MLKYRFLLFAKLFGWLIVTLLLDKSVLAEELTTQKSTTITNKTKRDRHLPEDALTQTTKVDLLKDVSPQDWAYEALTNLIEKYGCIAAYQDRTFRGDRLISRYEFAASLSTCLDNLTNLSTQNEISQIELSQIQRLTTDFARELKNINSQIEAQQEQITVLEENQFSTTTKLYGEAVFALTGVVTGDDLSGQSDRTTTFSDRVYLDFVTSFTGEDALWVELYASNTNPRTDLFEGTLNIDASTDNSVDIGYLVYFFPLGEKTQIALQGVLGAFYDYTDTVNVLDGLGYGKGALSYFASRNPIYSGFGAGVGIRHEFSETVEFSGGYLVPDASVSNPNPGNGLFDGAFSALAQLTLKPNDNLKFGLTYIRGYNTETFTGSTLSNFQSFTASNFGRADSISSDAYGLEFSWSISDRFIFGGWAGYTDVGVLNGQFAGGSLDLWTWATIFSFPDLIKEGDIASIIVGMEPKVTNSSGINLSDRPDTDADTSLHIEAFYKHQLTDNISLTPGIIWLTAPNHNNDNDDLLIGVLRTTFSL